MSTKLIKTDSFTAAMPTATAKYAAKYNYYYYVCAAHRTGLTMALAHSAYLHLELRKLGGFIDSVNRPSTRTSAHLKLRETSGLRRILVRVLGRVVE